MDLILSFFFGTDSKEKTQSSTEHYYHISDASDQLTPQSDAYSLTVVSKNGYRYEPITYPEKEEVIVMRKALVGKAQTVFYAKNPLMVVKARAQYLFDDQGRRFLDCISNVQHVGHCHPAVVQAVAQQMAMSNCNSRFLHGALVEVARQLKTTLPEQIAAVYMCNSGSEANDLALRIARDYTGATDVIVLEHAYHGHLISTIDLSPYKFDRLGNKKDWVHVAPTPDAYRGKHRLASAQLYDPEAQRWIARQYAQDVRDIVDKIKMQGRKLAAFYMEALESCGGQIIPPNGYFDEVIDIVHEAGGLVVVDEVQTGFGRSGTHFWGWQSHAPNAVPDIVTMGKPMGNGFPVSAVWCRQAVADSLGHGVEYFNTFGGNPVSCAAVLAVLRVLRTENLQENARDVGEYFIRRLRSLQTRHKCIGDVRGVGLFIGVDLVKDRTTREPATELAAECMLHLREKYCILLNSEGPHSNIVKIKPPMCFTKRNVDEVCNALEETFQYVGK